MANYRIYKIQDILALTKALADENRIRALMMLRQGELCVCQIIEILGLAPSTVSKHMSILRQAGLAEGHKQGRWMFYSLPDRHAPLPVRQAVKLLLDNLEGTPQIKKDDKKLQSTLSMDKETLCRKQMKR